MDAKEREHWRSVIARERVAEDKFAQRCMELDSWREHSAKRYAEDARMRAHYRARAVGAIKRGLRALQEAKEQG